MRTVMMMFLRDEDEDAQCAAATVVCKGRTSAGNVNLYMESVALAQYHSSNARIDEV